MLNINYKQLKHLENQINFIPTLGALNQNLIIVAIPTRFDLFTFGKNKIVGHFSTTKTKQKQSQDCKTSQYE